MLFRNQMCENFGFKIWQWVTICLESLFQVGGILKLNC